MKLWISIALVLLAGWFGDARAADVGVIEIRGTIGPATASYISRAIQVSAKRNDACLLIELNTPGGLVPSTQSIVDSFYAASVPIVVYVSPSGAGATSAGTFITMAANVAAMAPHSTIGAAHPVGAQGEGNTNEVMWAKAENYVASWAKTIAEKRGRNAEWIQSAVRQSVSITAEEAIDLNVIDLIATDVPDLLEQLDGRKVDGKELKTAKATLVPIPRTLGEKFFQMVWHPEIMLLLMLIATWGIIGEISNPGAVLPGVAGAIALVLFLYMSTILPVNIAGIALIVLAILLFVIDIFAPTHGVLTAGGIVSFFLGAMMLFSGAGPAFHLSLAYIIPATAMTALFFIFVVGAGLHAQTLPVQAGKETMIGRQVVALTRIDSSTGKLFVEGEYWNAVSQTPVEAGQPVEITAVNGLTLVVKPKPQQ